MIGSAENYFLNNGNNCILKILNFLFDLCNFKFEIS